MNELDALSLEYQRDYGTARGNLEVSNLVNNPFVNSPSGIFGLLGTKESGDLSLIEIRIRRDDAANALLLRQDTL